LEEIRGNSPPHPSVKTGLLLIKIGVVLALVIPIAMIFVFGSIVGQFGVFWPFPMLFSAIMIVFVTVSWVLSILALKFGYDVVNAGQKYKADYVIILGVVVFLVGSNIAGILIAIGGYLIRKQS
jgi:hypothetical protein